MNGISAANRRIASPAPASPGRSRTSGCSPRSRFARTSSSPRSSARRYRREVRAVHPDVLLADAGLADLAERPAATLDYGNQRRLELARAAALAPAYLLLDEPTSGMSDTESVAMVQHVRATAQLVGAGVLVIDHDLAFITRISDHVVVLAGGQVLAEGTPAQIRTDPAVAEAYLGRQATT